MATCVSAFRRGYSQGASAALQAATDAVDEQVLGAWLDRPDRSAPHIGTLCAPHRGALRPTSGRAKAVQLSGAGQFHFGMVRASLALMQVVGMIFLPVPG